MCDTGPTTSVCVMNCMVLRSPAGLHQPLVSFSCLVLLIYFTNLSSYLSKGRKVSLAINTYMIETEQAQRKETRVSYLLWVRRGWGGVG